MQEDEVQREDIDEEGEAIQLGEVKLDQFLELVIKFIGEADDEVGSCIDVSLHTIDMQTMISVNSFLKSNSRILSTESLEDFMQLSMAMVYCSPQAYYSLTGVGGGN